MKQILVINASARTRDSHSRKLTESFIEHWKKKDENVVITYRELGSGQTPHIDENWIAASFKPASIRTADENSILELSDQYIRELHDADIILLGTPMYNWSVPSPLKAYIDHVLRVNETFSVDAANETRPYTGLLKNKTMFLLLSRGLQCYEEGEVNASMNFQSSYIRTVFGIMGIEAIHQIAIDGTSVGKDILKRATEIAHQNLKDLIEKINSHEERGR